MLRPTPSIPRPVMTTATYETPTCLQDDLTPDDCMTFHALKVKTKDVTVLGSVLWHPSTVGFISQKII